jgi:predicted  nucleic acid-binding Zn-ribbon protein
MDVQLADEFSKALISLEAAKEKFDYNLKNGIMDAMPVRIMDECKKKLSEADGKGLPDASKYPKLHGYLAKIEAERLEMNEMLKRHEDFMQSKDGLKMKAMAEIGQIQMDIQGCLREKVKFEEEARKYNEKAHDAKSKSDLLYEKLTRAHFALAQLGD